MTITQTNLAELYVSFFNRAPDSAGLAYWVDKLDKGALSLEDISKNWMSEQAEGLAKYPVELNHTDFITQIYQATLGRAPDAEGLAYWQDQLTNNSVGRDVFLAAVINGAKANSSAQGVLDAATLSNKATAGVAFADKGLNDLTLAGQVVASVNSNPATLAAAQAVIKLVPATAADVTPALITLLSKTFDSIINLNDKAPGEVGDLATYLTAVANQATGTTDLSALLTNVTTTVTNAATNSTALDNPATLAGEAVAAATPSTGGGGTPVTPTVTVIESKAGFDNINVTAHPAKVVIQFGQDKQALATQAVADDAAYATANLAANAAKLIADATNAPALLAAAENDADSFSTLDKMDLFTGFTIGTDKIDLLSVSGGAVAQPAGLERVGDVATANIGDLSSMLTTAFSGTAANNASLVVIKEGTAAGTYLYVNDADAAFSATADVFIQLVGVTPDAVGQLKVSDYFA